MNGRFYVGLHQPSNAQHFARSFISINRLRTRKGPFPARRWIMDSGAFTEIATFGHYRHDVAEYASAARRWIGNGELEAIVAQDWMCEPWIVAKTGLSVREHQRLTVERYDALMDQDVPCYILPVLQGFQPDDYRRHIEMYGDRLKVGAWVGVGSVCKRNGRPDAVEAVLAAVTMERPDLRKHAFGLKKTALLHGGVRRLAFSADSLSWSFNARMNGRNPNDWREAKAFEQSINEAAGLPVWPWQAQLNFEGITL